MNTEALNELAQCAQLCDRLRDLLGQDCEQLRQYLVGDTYDAYRELNSLAKEQVGEIKNKVLSLYSLELNRNAV